MKKILALIFSIAMLTIITSMPAMAEEPVELEFFCTKSEVQGVMQEIIDAFCAENPGVKIVISCPADTSTVLRTRVGSGDVPDILMIYPAESTYKAFYDSGYILDLSGYDFMQNVQQSMLDLAEYQDGIQISVPYTLSTYGIFYNKDIFAELELSVPTTLEELIDTAKVIKEAGYDAFTLPLQNGQDQIAERLLGAFDGDTYLKFQQVFDGELTIDEVPSVTALAELFTALKPYSTADAMGCNGDSATSAFVNGEAAMRFNGSWFLSSVLTANPEMNVGMFGIPSASGDVKIPVNIDTGFAVSAKSEHQEIALKFLEFLTRTEIAQKYYEVDGNINMIKGVEYDKAQMMDTYKLVMNGDMTLTQINLWGPNATNVRSDMGAALQSVYTDGAMDTYYELAEAAVMDNF
ncbi:MAG: extracellular solute-binding protein [Christensenellales bacterium]|nr:extracellular solute-binding protein [Christensenellales bacterium]